MRRFLLDTGIAGCYIDRRRGVFERAQSESSLGNWIGIAHPVLAELAYRAAPIGTVTCNGCNWRLLPGSSGRSPRERPSSMAESQQNSDVEACQSAKTT